MSTAEKLKILKGSQSGSSFSYSDTILEVAYNPTDYSEKKSSSFNELKVPGLSSPIIQYSNGEAGTLDLELMLDTYTTDSASKDSVKTLYIEPLETLLEIDSDLHAPPPCKVIWGDLEFEGVLTSMSKKYTLFSGDGKTLRARVTLAFKELVSLTDQLSGSPRNSPDRRKLFTVKEGDSIWELAHTAYGDPGLWRVIADANKINSPNRLEVGRDLIIPVLKPEMKN